jgi:HEPN domain-containing protein
MNKKIALEWLKSASDDLILIQEIINNVNLTHMIAFHAQQAVEKSLKAILEYHNNKVPKKHDLIQLKIMVSDFIQIDDDDTLDSLNRLYIEARYPGDLGLLPNGKPDIDDAKVFYNCAENIYREVKKLIV